ncbi:dihydrofolate reductase [Alkalicoccus urumqiensis]|uniref:Dihydrofolate reductase n=1 Tax=Alkalicoccus urumqiensis TaxID=1548213 RepID=A0A2P6MGY5_ALKUR|nr:dihydrofolate reductase [Alkalicoccus urumqiensis]PRO65537.1 dihydrofolate reductase [Alkalicoccus urumqiensis]
MISIIAAMDENRVIGKDGGMPWHLPGDLRFFKQQTEGKTVVMGRATFESIGRALPKRRNIVLTGKSHLDTEADIELVHSMEEIRALHEAAPEEELIIMGGASLYEAALPEADTIYLTRIHAQFEGDTWFPEFSLQEWELTREETGTVDEKNAWPHTFQWWSRKVAPFDKM